jgi:anti-anti-sigma factor
VAAVRTGNGLGDYRAGNMIRFDSSEATSSVIVSGYLNSFHQGSDRSDSRALKILSNSATISFPGHRCGKITHNRRSGPTSNRVGSKSESLERASVGLQISIREPGDVTILDLRGRSTIDGESELLSRRIERLVGNGVHKLLLNLADLTQVDSSGISVIIEAYVSVRDRGGDLKLLCPSGRVLEVLKVVRLLEIIPSFEDESQALASFRGQSYFARR